MSGGVRGAAVEGCGGCGGEFELPTLMSALGTWSMRRIKTDNSLLPPLLLWPPNLLKHLLVLVPCHVLTSCLVFLSPRTTGPPSSTPCVGHKVTSGDMEHAADPDRLLLVPNPHTFSHNSPLTR